MLSVKGRVTKVLRLNANLQPTSHVEFHATAIINPLFVAPTFLQIDGELSTSCAGCFRVVFKSWDHSMQSVIVLTDLGIESAESRIAESRGTNGNVGRSGFADCCNIIEDLEKRTTDS